MGNVTIRGMLISDEFITDDIHATEEYKEYEKVFVRVDVPTIQSQLKKQKRKQVAGETRSPKPSLKIRVKQMKPSTTPIPPPSDDRERDEIAEVTLLCLTMHKTTLAAKAQENVAKVQEKLMEEDIEKMVDDVDEEPYASEFANSVFLNDEEDFDTRLEFRNHKENPETVDDDDDDVEGKKDEKKDDDDDDNDDH
ncbi:hypothetical protein Tco_0881504, partial [Tanacetum coccineum]